MSGGLEFSRVLFRSYDPLHAGAVLAEAGWAPPPEAVSGTPEFVRRSGNDRSEERRGGEEGRCRGDWSSAVCSSDLTIRCTPARCWPRPGGRRPRRPFLAPPSSCAAAVTTDRKSVVEGKRGDVGGIGVQPCALPILRSAARRRGAGRGRVGAAPGGRFWHPRVRAPQR